MSVKHLLACDGPECDKSQAYHPLEWRGKSPVPDKWFILTQGDGGMETLHFCSLPCMKNWSVAWATGQPYPEIRK